jgi:hypothetical protein
MNIETVYYGPSDAMIEEVGALDKRAYCNEGFYVLPVGEGQWDTESFSTLAEAKAYALAEYGNAPIAYVC